MNVMHAVRDGSLNFMKACAAALLLGLVVSSSGCGTIANTASSGENTSGVPQLVIFGGLRTDAAEIDHPGMFRALSALWIFDLPLSLGLDTAFLPVTVLRETFFPPQPVQGRPAGIFGGHAHW